MGSGVGWYLRAGFSSGSFLGYSFCVERIFPDRLKSSKSTVHLEEKQLGGLGKESKSPSAHQSSNLTANHEAVAQKSPRVRSRVKEKFPRRVSGDSNKTPSCNGAEAVREVSSKIFV